MRRRAAILFVLAALAPWGCTRDATDVRRSIVLVVIDTLRRDHLPVHGGTTDTPHLSSLAERGVALGQQRHALLHGALVHPPRQEAVGPVEGQGRREERRLGQRRAGPRP